MDKSCLLCRGNDESHSHLFFSFPFSKKLWEKLKHMANMDNMSNLWASAISGLVSKPPKNTIWNVIQRIVFCATVYFIWQERNMRKFAQKERTVEVLYNVVVDTVRFKLLGLKLKYTPDVIKAAKVWKFGLNKDSSSSHNFDYG
ncbi:RNA-directed DNA polymerase, eukaryota, Reverse transcriptase zinc-binding domain protein [Artemisia annua]|uniref:RNA-directed DNA polymerase, eukaryota, Reverse transcriptase zinc-binding domain protein n=1 Tax=Artemisia annua TaxID=35608 RepID=A0A2U1KMY4_ARTAN|nr:RNA-directed DNA polymerase, eukaryota, Reverse transcriptase zinc-binding domain protein [Artemisia annua]